MIKVTLNDGSVKEFESGVSVLDVANAISAGLARNACCGIVDGKVVDLRDTLDKDVELSICTFDSQEGKDAVRHSISHVLAYAVKRLFPEAKLAIGPSIEDGFYYDFDVDVHFSSEDLTHIEDEMKKIIKENPEITRFELPREEALELMKDEPYKVELINDLPEDAVISFYKMGDFTDLCAGPHLMSIKNVKAIKLLKSTGAYWKGSEKNKMLSRIYGTAFLKKADLDAHLEALEEARQRDHNKLGRELKLFTTSEAVGQGLPLIMPKGAKIIQLLQRWVEDEEEKRGYLLTKTPSLAKNDLFKISGHWDHYKEDMFVLGDEEKDDEVFCLRPMTCPFQYEIYKADQHSYRDLPLRYNETATEYRKEASGEMHGLIRLRQFTLSDAHLIVRPDQLEEEFKSVLELIQYLMGVLGLDEGISYRFSKWDPNNTEKYINDPEAWDKTEGIMRKILNHLEIDYYEAADEAAFYGPKLDLQYKNVHGKEDTLFTIQIDFAAADRFDMYYIDKDGEKKRPYVIHRSAIGCYERTLAMLIEKYAGALPTWLSPVQVKVLPISDKYADYAEEVVKRLKDQGIRVEADYRTEKIGYKIREARLERVPYICVVGEKESESNTLSVRSRKNGEEGSIDLVEFEARLLTEIANKER
ncbi:threonyl-tRNA synthetase [Clostridium sp. DSM 8431]|uniref:threonine--tRNA ligase n=1 Tax=Clostridium sp. DSM 8431 TaxID=1761781 RepID=UPI0008E2DCC5|nr:threonine--tRNA ligase [Clostridium sp. DSM 8431]SFU80602.1 threonyl-tRNA synthetase [Clostridium sp. DSM 8431]